jgi:hypothetical protein
MASNAEQDKKQPRLTLCEILKDEGQRENSKSH